METSPEAFTQAKEGIELSENITQAEERVAQRSETYLKGIVEFTKWTSTVTTAAMLWIGNNIISITGPPRRLAIAALICLAVSLIVAISLLVRIIIAQAQKWTLANAECTALKALAMNKMFSSIASTQKMKTPTTKELTELKRIIDAAKAHQPFSQPKGFQAWIICYIVLLLVGLSLYISAQIWAAL